MPFPKREVKSQLLLKFEFVEVEGSNHEAVAFYYEGKKIATTRFSRGSNQDIGDKLLKVMARQVRVETLNFFKKMIECTNSLEDYTERLRELSYI